jgi:hypothetical protein
LLSFTFGTVQRGGLPLLIDAIRKNTALPLERLHLSQEFDQEDIVALGQLMSDNRPLLKELWLEVSPLCQTVSVVPLLEALAENTHIQYLTLFDYNEVTQEETIALAQLLQSPRCAIKRLWFPLFNVAHTGEPLFRALRENRRLEFLHLHGKLMKSTNGDELAENISAMIAENKDLRVLSIPDVSFTPSETATITQGLARNSGLRGICLPMSPGHHFSALSQVLAQHPTLERADIHDRFHKGTPFSDDYGIMLLEAVTRNPRIRLVDFENACHFLPGFQKDNCPVWRKTCYSHELREKAKQLMATRGCRYRVCLHPCDY